MISNGTLEDVSLRAGCELVVAEMQGALSPLSVGRPLAANICAALL